MNKKIDYQDKEGSKSPEARL